MFFSDAIWRRPTCTSCYCAPRASSSLCKTIRLHLPTDSTTLQSADREKLRQLCVQLTTFKEARKKVTLDLLLCNAAGMECCHTLLGQKKISPNPPLISRYPSLPANPRQNDCRNMKGLVRFGTWNGIYFSLCVSTVGGGNLPRRKKRKASIFFLSFPMV